MKKSLFLLFATYLATSLALASPAPFAADPAFEKAAMTYTVSAEAVAIQVVTPAKIAPFLVHQSAPALSSFRLTETLARVGEPGLRPSMTSHTPKNPAAPVPERPCRNLQLT